MKTLFDIHDPDLNVEGMHFLEASAGTGKTYTIEHLVARLILEAGINIEQILVVTFTRAAARELRTRIRATLLRTREALDVPELQKKIDAALICFDAAQIFTLHGFCHRILSEFSFECRVAGELAPVEDVSLPIYYKKLVTEQLLEGLSPRDFCPEQLRIALHLVKNDPARLINKIVSLLSTDGQIADYPSLEENYLRFSAALQRLSYREEDFALLSACYKGMNNSAFPDQVARLTGLVQKGACTQREFEQLLTTDTFFLEQLTPENLKKRSTPPKQSMFLEWREYLWPPLKEASSPMKIVLRLAKQCQARKSPDSFSPDEMLHRVNQALESPAFAEAVRRKYQAAIIDEFQDTDPVQWSIFKRAFVGHLKTVYLVGDPKQSIYAFRSADIYTYLDAAKSFGKENHKYLDTNFRSSPSLIQALNALFSAPQGKGWISLPRIRDAMPVDPVKAGVKRPDASSSPIHFFFAQGDSRRGTVWPTKDTEEQQLFPFIASKIHELTVSEEIAVLVKDRFQAERLISFLKTHHIPASFRKGESLLESAAFRAFKECLQAVLAPSHLSTLKIVLAGPLFRWDEHRLRGGFETSLLQQAKVEMQTLQNILTKEGIGPFFSRLLERAEGNVTLYQHLRKLCEILIEEEINSRLHGSDFLGFLQEIDPQDDRFFIAPPEAKGSVTVMTVHLSKGLEFDTVFALALASRHAIKQEDAVKREGKLVAREEEGALEAIEELDAEKMRLLYVALTRAKQRVYIPYVVDNQSKSVSLGDAAPIELFLAKISKECMSQSELYEEISRLDQQRIERLLSQIGHMSYSSAVGITLDAHAQQVAPAVPLATPPPLCVPPPLRLVSFSSLTASSEIQPINAKELTGPPPGSATGIVVHRIFEMLFKDGLHHPFELKHIQALIARETEGTPLASHREWLEEKVASVLHLALDEQMRLVDISAAHMTQELEFLFPMQDGFMKGFADLIFQHEGKYYLLDWKTNYLEDYSLEKMECAMQQHQYFLQASIYASALQRYVKLFDIRPFEELFGGALYVFVRGPAVYHFIPEVRIL